MGASEDRMDQLIKGECDKLCNFLQAKNRSYGNSVAEPVRVFSKASPAEQMAVRMDDKLSRMLKGKEYPGDNDKYDLMGYLLLERVVERFLNENEFLERANPDPPSPTIPRMVDLGSDC